MASPSLKVLTEQALAAKKVLDQLWDERSSTCDTARYNEIVRPGGLITQAEKAKRKARENLQKRIKSLTGLYAYSFVELL